MRGRLANLWRWDSTIDRSSYLLFGLVLVVLKHTLDWLLARRVFGEDWSPFSYLVLPTRAAGLFRLPPEEQLFYGALVLLAVPFIYVGVTLTLQRLRSAGLPAWTVLFFFVPLVNLLFFLVLCLLPAKPAEPLPATDQAGSAQELTRPFAGHDYGGLASRYRQGERWRRVRAAHQRLTRESSAASAALSLAICVPLALAFVFASASNMGVYGMGLFVGLPFALGLGSVVLFGLARPQGFAVCMLVACLAVIFTGIGILLVALEGAICLIMAAPIAFFLAALGALVGYAIQARPWSHQDNPTVFLSLLVLLPALLAAESLQKPQPPPLQVTSVVEIDAPPEAVWDKVVAFPELPPPSEWLFKSGVAYPLRAEIQGTGKGAVRRCVFSTGTFVEPIEEWQAPTLLRFRVEDQPCPMEEWSFFDIHPPHLDNYLVCSRGEFRLIALPEGRTRLEGTTWYTNRMWPAWYWQLWSDEIIHRIHLRVLEHIKAQAEQPPRS